MMESPDTCTPSACFRLQSLAEVEIMFAGCDHIAEPERFSKLARVRGKLMAAPCSFYCEPAKSATAKD